MAPLVLLVPAYAIAVLSSRPADQGCPSARQVADALAQRMPGVIAPASRPLPPGVLELALDAGPSSVSVVLRDQLGGTRLNRTLSASPQCSAMAETVALIVDRFLQEIGYLGPPASVPPASVPSASATATSAPSGSSGAVEIAARSPTELPRPRGGIHLVSALRAVPGGGALVELGAGASVHHGNWLELFEAAYVPQQRTYVSGGSATLQRVALRLALHHARHAGPGTIEPGVAFGLDLLTAGLTRPESSSSSFRMCPSLQAALGYRVSLAGPWWFVRLEASAAVNLVRYRFVSFRDDVVFQDPRAQVRLGLSAGRHF